MPSKEYYLKNCESIKAKVRQYKIKNKEKILEKDRKYHSTDWYMLIRARQRAKKKGLDFNLTIEDIIIPEFCPIMGFKLNKEKGGRRQHSPTLDRVDNTKGYVKGNVKVISSKANQCKSDLSFEQIKRLYEYSKEI